MTALATRHRASGPTSTHLIHFDGTAGSTTLTDVGSDAVVVTAGGAGVIETSIVKFGSGALDCVSGTGWASLAYSADQDFGSGDFTIDCWVYPTSGGGASQAIFNKSLNSATVGAFHIKIDPLFMLLSSTRSAWDYIINSGVSLSNNAWHHVALVRHGTLISLYADGTSVASQVVSAGYTLYANAADVVSIGSGGSAGGEVWQGKIDEFAMTNVARWTANFTPPVAAYTH
jgi:Concanavalin A-like lectin/glucanases superfamily